VIRLRSEKADLEKQVVELRARANQIERRSNEQRLAEERKHAEEIQFLKRTNQQLKVFPCITKIHFTLPPVFEYYQLIWNTLLSSSPKAQKIQNYNSTRFIWVWTLVFQWRGEYTLRVFMNNMVHGPNTAISTKRTKWYDENLHTLNSSPSKVKIIKYRTLTWERPVVHDEITKH